MWAFRLLGFRGLGFRGLGFGSLGGLCKTSADHPSEKHAKMLNQAAYNVNYKFKLCAVCALLLPPLYNNSRPQQDYAMGQDSAVPVQVHIS